MVSFLRWVWGAAALGFLLGSSGAAAQYLSERFDPLGAGRAVPFERPEAMIDQDLMRTGVCPSGAPSHALHASESISRALCANPQARQVWTDIQLQVAMLGSARASYLPTLNGSYGVQRASDSSAAGATTTRAAALSLSWTVFDFGARSSDVDSQKALLKALAETGNVTLQNIFLTTAQDYYSAVAARAQADAAQRAESIAREVYEAADAKAQAGVASLGDRLQAKTAYDQAVMDRVQALADYRNAVGILAGDMGLSPSESIELAEASDSGLADFKKMGPVDALLDRVKRSHPSVLAAAARFEAAQAARARVIAQGRPSVTFSGSLGRTDGAFGARSNVMSVQVSIPIFDGFSRNYQVQAATASVETEKNTLDAAEKLVAINLWKAYHTLSAATDNLGNARLLVEDAEKSLDVAKGRYFGGVGTLIDLLNAQNVVASARQQKIRALSQWLGNRLQLAASLGHLGFGDIE